jgi:hypothetical protein
MLKKHRFLSRVIVFALCLLAVVALAVSASNSYVKVDCSTVGVDGIVPIGLDFYITTTNVADSFTPNVTVTKISTFELVAPIPSTFNMYIGESKLYEVKNQNNIEETKISGNIILFKVDVEIDGVGEDKEETEGAFVNYASCENGGISSPACAGAMKPVKIRCLPANRPDNEMIILTFPAKHLLEKVGDNYQAAQSSYKVKEIANKKFFLHGHAPSGALRDYEIKATHNLNGCHDVAKYTIAKVDLDSMKIYHNTPNGELPDSEEIIPGAFVPINNDDDDYDSDNLADMEQSGSITGESDLLQIKLHKSDPAVTGSKYTLDIPTQVKIWKQSNRSDSVTGSTEFDAAVDTILYVEGVKVGSGNIKINWKNGATAFDDCDEIKVTAYNWIGPLTVPGYALHRYTANGALGSSKWVAPNEGMIKTGADTSDVTILWDCGPVVGKAIYQVNENYVWDLEVNIVQVKIKEGDSNIITYWPSPEQDPLAPAVIWSSYPSTGIPAMTSKMTVEYIIGPTVNGKERGAKFIQMGFIQNVKICPDHADYLGFTPHQRRVSSVETLNATLLDYLDFFQSAPSTKPWYDSQGATGTRGYLAATDSLEDNLNIVFHITDYPNAIPTDSMSQIIGTVTDSADIFSFIDDFKLYFAVRTTDTRNKANTIYTQRGKVDWKFDASGTIVANIWTQTGTGTKGDRKFTEVTNGDIVPETTGMAATLTLKTQDWSWIVIP